jgi:hypothetical protein
MKLCTVCDQTKPLDAFHKGKVYAGGYRTWCKVCMSEYKKQYRIKNKEQLKEKQAVYDAVNNPLRREYFAKRYLEQKQRIDSINKAYREANLDKHAAKETKRRASKLKRTPAWLTKDDRWMIEQAYELAALRTKMFGFAWHVDHVIPLQGKLVSGLHVPENLQVIPAVLNQQKHNTYEVLL